MYQSHRFFQKATYVYAGVFVFVRARVLGGLDGNYSNIAILRFLRHVHIYIYIHMHTYRYIYIYIYTYICMVL